MVRRAMTKPEIKFAGGSGIGSAVGNGFVFILFILSRNVWYIDVMTPTSECPEDLETHLERHRVHPREQGWETSWQRHSSQVQLCHSWDFYCLGKVQMLPTEMMGMSVVTWACKCYRIDKARCSQNPQGYC